MISNQKSARESEALFLRVRSRTSPLHGALDCHGVSRRAITQQPDPAKIYAPYNQ
jgi:hypothetical protein